MGSNLEIEFRRWRNSIPLEPKSAQALGNDLAVFFQVSERLIKIDANLMQDVISCLSEGGLKRIQELIEQEFHNMSTLETTVAYLEQSLVVFSYMLESNSTAFIQESLIPLAKGFEEISIAIESSGQGPLYEARKYLEAIKRKLEIGSSLPAVYPAYKTVKEKPAVISQEPPGGRHDNDHEDICDIKIMPTWEEIMSSRIEYLPVKDPMQWCIPGLDGLLDRNFRLLREDMIGQLRDAMQPELQKLLANDLTEPRDEKQHRSRIHMYEMARLTDMQFDSRSGLWLKVTIRQPYQMAEGKLQEWWQISKRL
ncbi:hypothetical protein V8E54_001849 [Elaphomyces granulatus]